jgi:hypothetical protein
LKNNISQLINLYFDTALILLVDVGIFQAWRRVGPQVIQRVGNLYKPKNIGLSDFNILSVLDAQVDNFQTITFDTEQMCVKRVARGFVTGVLWP